MFTDSCNWNRISVVYLPSITVLNMPDQVHADVGLSNRFLKDTKDYYFEQLLLLWKINAVSQFIKKINAVDFF